MSSCPKKKKAFRNKDREEMKEAQREVKRYLKEAKNTYRKKVEKKLADNNMRDVWEGVRTITDHKAKTEGGGVERANDLNQFFNRVCPRLLQTCAAELGEPLQRVFNLSLELGKVPTLWKTSCIIPVPKKNRPSELNDFRPVALTSHLMKTLERLFLNLLRPQVQHAEDSLQFAYRDKVGVEDAIIYLLHRVHSHLDKGSGTARILFLDFSSAFNTIQPLVLQDKLLQMRVDPCLVAWISSYLTDRPQFVRMKDITSDTVVSSIGAPQGTVLSPILFTLYTSDFCYNSEMCHIQKFADDTAIVGCIRDNEEEEYRCLVRDFVAWCHNNGLQLNTSKTKELVIDFGRDRPRPRPVQIGTEEVEGVQTYKYLGLWLDNRLDWTSNTRQL
ncbi:putative RNA-directed DNA polymerase from transposon BS [Takifugu flavidus]|uniref:Putative RNA-directed DNA polymerase from transposon BS n=1 Tax=Takifugu flavidus TaxID=433684 RepID=A0A5C6N942_9TELE|nr:putative RNA-directed DNA polymerase from transposon BS [Takifugu flavidus]